MRTKGKREEEENASLKGSSYTIKRENKKRKEKNSKGNDIEKLMNTNSDRLGKSN